MRDFKGAVVLIAGGGSGIGFGAGQAFAEAGARIALADIDGQAAQAAAARLRDTGAEAIGLALDVADRSAWQSAVKTVEAELGPIDVLCNSAGIGGARKPAIEIPPDRYQRMWGITVMGVIHGVQTVVPTMKGRGGSVIHVASMAGMDPVRTIADYAASKFAVVALSEVLAMEVAEDGVEVTIVCPGVIRTQLSENTEKILGEALTAPKQPPTSTPMEPLECGRIIRRAAAHGALYCFTHPESEPRIAKRFQKVLDSFALLKEPL